MPYCSIKKQILSIGRNKKISLHDRFFCHVKSKKILEPINITSYPKFCAPSNALIFNREKNENTIKYLTNHNGYYHR